MKLGEMFKAKVEGLYDLLNNEEDARVCKDISEDACRYTPANYFRILISNTMTTVGDALSNPKTVLAWLMSYVNAPIYLISFIVPIRESGSMIPQIFIASLVRKQKLRKWFWVAGSLLQFLSIMGIGWSTLNFNGSNAGWFIIIFLILFSLARGLCSVASKDVLGKTIPKKRRGKLKGYTVSVSGILVLAIGLFMVYQSSDQQNIRYYSYFIFGAGLMWLFAALVYSTIKEFPGETTSGGGNAFNEARERMKLIVTDKPFRKFIVSRSLLLCSALTAPFYVLLAQEYVGKEGYLLGLFIIANGVASIISAPIWGKMADISSKTVMARAALITATLGIITFIIITWVPVLREKYWLYPVAFFILGVAHSGVRLGRKTYVVDMAQGDKRTDYVAVSNTIIGLILLVTGGISALVSIISLEGIILVLSVFGLAGAWTSIRLPNVEN